jgi:protein-disulfide isomerase/uncharacterized membrane protein
MMKRNKGRDAPARSGESPNTRGRLTLLLWLCIAGCVLAAWLVWIHLQLLIAPGAGSACNFGGHFDCDVVNASTHSEIFGVPIAYPGFVFYAVLAALAAAERFRGASPRALAYARGLGTAAALYSIFLAFLSALVIEAFCLFCVGLHVVNFGIAGVGWYKAPARPRFLATLGADLRLLLTGFSAWRAQAALAVAVLGAVALAQYGDRLRAAGESEVIAKIGDRRLVAAPGHSAGNASSALVVVEFADFECSHCAAASLLVERLRREIGSSVRFVFKHFPLDPSCNRAMPRGMPSRRSCAAATGAVCAGEQGRFWEYQSRIFERGTSTAVMRSTVKELGLDVEAWQKCLSSMRAASAVKNDIEDGMAVGIQSTPTFLIGERIQRGGLPYDSMLRLIRKELAAANEAAQGS